MEAELPTQPSHADEMQLDSRTRRTVIQPRAGLTAEEIAAEQVANQPINNGLIPNVQVDTESTAPNQEAEEPDQPYTMPLAAAAPTSAATHPTGIASAGSSKKSARKPIVIKVAVATLTLVLAMATAYYLVIL